MVTQKRSSKWQKVYKIKSKRKCWKTLAHCQRKIITFLRRILQQDIDKSFSLIHDSFSGGSDGKEPASIAGDLGLIPGSGRSSGERNCNPLQYSCLENFLCDRESYGQRSLVSYSPWGHKELDMTEWLTVSLLAGSCYRLFLVGIPVLLNSSLSFRYSTFHSSLKAGSLVILSMHNFLSGILLPWLKEKVTKLS